MTLLRGPLPNRAALYGALMQLVRRGPPLFSLEAGEALLSGVRGVGDGPGAAVRAGAEEGGSP